MMVQWKAMVMMSPTNNGRSFVYEKFTFKLKFMFSYDFVFSFKWLTFKLYKRTQVGGHFRVLKLNLMLELMTLLINNLTKSMVLQGWYLMFSLNFEPIIINSSHWSKQAWQSCDMHLVNLGFGLWFHNMH